MPLRGERMICFKHLTTQSRKVMACATSDGWLLKLEEFVANKSNDKTRLSDSGVPKKYQLEMAHASSSHMYLGIQSGDRQGCQKSE
mmetsp:Transcript_10569/g.31813  ORF Transcript_10569/g.31813 Transcript_10569/m.31813 type:complete len:86 (+) Transcript_10569:1207-1464(+)